MGTHPIFESDFDCLTDCKRKRKIRDRTKNSKKTDFGIKIWA